MLNRRPTPKEILEALGYVLLGGGLGIAWLWFQYFYLLPEILDEWGGGAVAACFAGLYLLFLYFLARGGNRPKRGKILDYIFSHAFGIVIILWLGPALIAVIFALLGGVDIGCEPGVPSRYC